MWISLQRGAWTFEIHRTMVSLQKERKEKTLLTSPPFLPVRVTLKRIPLPRSSSPPPAAHLPSCNLSFALKAAFLCVLPTTAYPRHGFQQAAAL